MSKGAFGRKNRSNRKGSTNTNPLRKIVGHDGGYEVLECGHKQWPRNDFVGETNAERRRCRQCGKAAKQIATTTETPTLSLRIHCPCGYYDIINGVRQDDPEHAKQRARDERWRYPTIETGPLVNGMIQAKGQCHECYEIEHETF